MKSADGLISLAPVGGSENATRYVQRRFEDADTELSNQLGIYSLEGLR